MKFKFGIILLFGLLILSSFAKFKISWISPIDSSAIKRIIPYGYGQNHPIFAPPKFNYGIRIISPKGTPVYAPFSGVITDFNKSKRSLGNSFTITHNNKYITRYGHLDSIHVQLDQQVKQGQIIGVVGSSGKTTAPNLYFELLDGEEKIDPMKKIKIEAHNKK